MGLGRGGEVGEGGGVKNPNQGTGVMVENPTNRTDFGRKLEKKSDLLKGNLINGHLINTKNPKSR